MTARDSAVSFHRIKTGFVIALAGCAFVSAGPVYGAQTLAEPSARPALLASVAGLQWLPAASLSANGVAFMLYPFISSFSVAITAQALAVQTGKFQGLQVFPGLVVLSGVKQGSHWLAYIERAVTGARGYVSFLPYKGPECSVCQ